MRIDALSTQLREQGVLLLRNVFAPDPLRRLKQAAAGFYESISSGRSLPDSYRFSRSSHSVLLTALLDFGCERVEDLMAPLSAPGLDGLFAAAMGQGWRCQLEQSWVRKKFAPEQAPESGYHLQNWHQDGALGVHFPPQPGPAIAFTDLLTCWIPFNDCGADSPGLEFVLRRQPALLHFTELDDAALRQGFDARDFWVPAMEFGDGLIFLNDILHRTYVHPRMRDNRMSIEYRIFPGEKR